eukprot:scaffold214642_cov32-Tisochrysis_lutea.AAC.1
MDKTYQVEAVIAREDVEIGQYVVVAEDGRVHLDSLTVSLFAGAADGTALYSVPLNSLSLGVSLLEPDRFKVMLVPKCHGACWMFEAKRCPANEGMLLALRNSSTGAHILGEPALDVEEASIDQRVERILLSPDFQSEICVIEAALDRCKSRGVSFLF